MGEGELPLEICFLQVLDTENLTLAPFKSNYKLRAAKVKAFHLPFLTPLHFQDQSFLHLQSIHLVLDVGTKRTASRNSLTLMNI